MKRTPLVRKTPLARGSPMKRTAIVRTSPMKPWRRDPADKVSPDEYAAVINRDGACFIYAFVDATHVCHNKWGDEHSPYDVLQLTYEHVKPNLRSSKRATSKREFAVACCHGGNVGVPSSVVRDKMRERLRTLYPAAWEGSDGAG